MEKYEWILTDASAPIVARLMVLVTVYYVLAVAILGLFIVWHVISQRYRKPPKDDAYTRAIRAAEREERWYPLPADTDIDRC